MTPQEFYRFDAAELDLERSSSRGNPVMSGELAVFNKWTEIRSALEGHYLERISPSAFKKTIQERMDRIRVLFQHGRDALVGQKPLGKILDLAETDDALRYKVELFRTDYVDELLPALEAGQYGTSFAFVPVKNTEEKRPERSDHNPEGLPEITREEVMLREFGPVTFPQYEEATAGLRSLTDDFVVPDLRQLAAAFGIDVKPRAAALPENDGSEGSRSTQTETEEPDEKEERPSWQLMP